jgi:type IV pilus assembly protein PilC
MAEFVCKVGDATGHVFQQMETAQSESEARQKLADRGFYVYGVRPNLTVGRLLGGARSGRKLPGNDFQIFNQQFNTLVKAGLPILKALDLLADRAALPKIRPIVSDVRDRVKQGQLLSDAVESTGMFPPVYSTALRAGEKSGDLPGVLDDYIAYQRTTAGLKKKLIGVLIYPMILIVVASCIVAYLVAYVIPQFAKLYSDLGNKLPGPTQFLLDVVVGYRAELIFGAAAIVFGAIFIFLWSRTQAGSIWVDRMTLKLPVAGDVWIKFQMAQFTRTLGTLLRGGTPLVTALSTAANAMKSRLVANSIDNASQRVREGATLHASLAETKMIPDLALDMIEVGEASGALSAMLGSVATFYEEESSMKIAALITVIEPAILVMMAMLIFFILVALYLPLFSLQPGAGG